MRLSLRSALILLPLATGTLLVQPGCSSSEGGSGLNSPAVAPPGNTTPVVQTTRVDELFEHPTQALIDDLLAEHTPSEDEMNVAAVYWAGLIVGNERGQIPEAFVASGIQDDVLALASKYPSFFRLSASGLYEPTPLGIRDLPGKPAGGCAEACFTPAQAVSLGFVAFGCLGASGIASGRAVIKTGNVGLGLAQGVWSRFEKNGSNVGSNKLKAYAAAVQGDGAALTFAVVDILAAAVSFGVASGGLALSPAAFGAVLIIGGISAGLQCGSAISKASVAYGQCQSWRAANCKCTSVVCAGPAPLCVDGNAATRTESCRDSDGACVSSTTVTRVCAAPTRTCNGPLLTMTTESCAVGACASNTTVVQDCASQPARSATCASATQRTTYTPTCKTTAGAPTCDYAETTTTCPVGQTCDAGICRCAVNGTPLDPVGTWRLATVDGAAPGTCAGPAAGYGAQTFSLGADGSFSNHYCQLNACPNSLAQTCVDGPQPATYQVTSCVNLTINQPGNVASGRFVYNAGTWELHTGSAGFPQYVYVK
jgi:hypothetical protein